MDLTLQQTQELYHHRNDLKMEINALARMERALADDKLSWNRGNALRQNRMLRSDQETEWEIPCGLKRQNAIMARIRCNEYAVLHSKRKVIEYEIQLRKFIESLPATAVPTAEDSTLHGQQPDVLTSVATCPSSASTKEQGNLLKTDLSDDGYSTTGDDEYSWSDEESTTTCSNSLYQHNSTSPPITPLPNEMPFHKQYIPSYLSALHDYIDSH